MRNIQFIRLGSKKDNYSSKAQLIRLSSKLLVDKFTKETPKLSDKDLKTNTGAIIGRLVDGTISLTVIFGGIFCVYFERNKMRKKEELGTPKYIKETVWAAKERSTIEANFFDSFGTQVAYTDGDVTAPETYRLFSWKMILSLK